MRKNMGEEQRSASETETLMGLITQRYGARLTPAELQEVRQGVESLTQVIATLRQVPLANSDEPFAVFIPYRQEG
jgi:hypothetical protein